LFLTFTDITEDDCTRMDSAETKSDVRQLLKVCMQIDQDEGYRSEILADMHYHNYAFCCSRGFSWDKTSTMLSIMRVVLEEAVSRRLGVEHAFDVFQDWLLRHGVQRPPQSIGIYSFEEVKLITEHVHNTFFRYYDLYMYVYMTHCDIDFRVADTDRGATAMLARSEPLRGEYVVEDPRSIPELAPLFIRSDAELADEEMHKMRERNMPEDKQTRIKRLVDEKMSELMDKFERDIVDQDTDHVDRLKEIEGVGK